MEHERLKAGRLKTKLRKPKRKSKRLGRKQKIMLDLLLAGIAIGFSHSPSTPWRVGRILAEEWGLIGRKHLPRTAQRLYEEGLLSTAPHADGTCTVHLTSKGRAIAVRHSIDTLKIQKTRWGDKWWLVTYDIPEKKRRLRQILADKLFAMGMCEMQRSVWVSPYPCDREVDFLTSLFGADEYVYKMLVQHIDNDDALRAYFGLPTRTALVKKV